MSIQSECRKEGRDSITAKLTPRQIAIIGELRMNPNGLTAYELNEKLRMSGDLFSNDLNTVKPRLTELCKANIIEPKGKRVSPSGVHTTVWGLVE